MEKGSSNNLGIPSTWLDENASDPIYANRYYSRENGWELIYSNITESTPTKYFALYHKYTGLLRFFFYEIASSAGLGSSEAFGESVQTKLPVYSTLWKKFLYP